MIPEYPGSALLGKGVQTPLSLRERCKLYVFEPYSLACFLTSLRVLGKVSGLPENGKQ